MPEPVKYVCPKCKGETDQQNRTCYPCVVEELRWSMDVDLLRPGTVPISPDTILWFEFLLDKDLLLKHLQKPYPDPSAMELITKFVNAVYDCTKNDVKKEPENGDLSGNSDGLDVPPKLSLKVILIKILALKVAAHIKWNLSTLKSLPVKTQITLLQDLLYFTDDEMPVEIPNVGACNPEMPARHVFALVIYHRWLIGVCMHKILINGQNRGNGELISMEENLICTPENVERSVRFLNEALEWNEAPPMLTYDCFVLLSESSASTQNDWNRSVPVTTEEFRAQLHYDMAVYLFYRESYDVAAGHFAKAAQYYRVVAEPVGFCSLDVDSLESYLSACNSQSRDSKLTLLQQLSASIANQYLGILNILIQDNKLREIPLVHRINLELDIQGAVSSGKFTVARDLLAKIQALNAVRCILSEDKAYRYEFKHQKSLEFLIWATAAAWASLNGKDKSLLRSYFIQLVINLDSEELLAKLEKHDTFRDMFDRCDADRLRKSISSEPKFPELLQETCWDFPDPKRNLKLEIRLLEQQIITSYDPKELRELLVKLTMKNPTRPVWKVNPQWELPIPLQSVVTSIPRGFLQDFSYVMLAKARELMFSKDWGSSKELLSILETEVQSSNGPAKLVRLISWEILLVQITQLFEEWPAPHIDRHSLIQACENCLKNSESIIPRTEVMEQCILCLLNLGRWEFFTAIDKPWSYFELASAVTSACQDIIKYKGNKKVSKELWELVVPAFGNSSSQSKRSASGSTSIIHRDSPLSNSKTQFVAFLKRLRDATCLAVVVSMLAKLYNILKDDGNVEINVDYIMLWPSAISNISSYNIGAVTEALTDLVLQALQYYPTNIPWLRLMGDISFSNSNYESALKYYLKSLIVSSEYFNVAIRGDDHIFRRMIKSCTQLGCHTQAAVLCQFLEEPDYTVAFRSLVDFKSCNDSVEAYYHCFWDTNILEYLVHLHHKRGEFQRRKKAIHTIGLLELNSNNNEEIQREAVNLRKRTFLQAMCKQYVQ